MVSVDRNLLGGELVWAAKSKCEALALKDALNAAGEAEEEDVVGRFIQDQAIEMECRNNMNT